MSAWHQSRFLVFPLNIPNVPVRSRHYRGQIWRSSPVAERHRAKGGRRGQKSCRHVRQSSTAPVLAVTCRNKNTSSKHNGFFPLSDRGVSLCSWQVSRGGFALISYFFFFSHPGLHRWHRSAHLKCPFNVWQNLKSRLRGTELLAWKEPVWELLKVQSKPFSTQPWTDEGETPRWARYMFQRRLILEQNDCICPSSHGDVYNPAQGVLPASWPMTSGTGWIRIRSI